MINRRQKYSVLGTISFKHIVIFIGLLFNGTAFADEPSEWQQMKGQDFIVYYHPGVPDDFAQTTLDTAEQEFNRVSDNLGVTTTGWAWDKKISIYIYSDRDDYVKNGGQAGWSHGAAFAQARTIRTYPDSAGFFDTILPHELGHIIFRYYIGFTPVVPLWFEEGVAIYQEKAKRLGSDKQVKEAIENGQFIPLSQLTGMRLYKNSDNQTVDLFYTESASVVYYLNTEFGEQEFQMLCTELKNGTPFDEALHKVYLRFENTDELNKEWLNSLQG
jgi:hypothetical protein